MAAEPRQRQPWCRGAAPGRCPSPPLPITGECRPRRNLQPPTGRLREALRFAP
ncbi:unnamed protein product, partial [Closterium sp. NIES-64]